MQDPSALKKLIQRWSEELGFDGIGVAGIDLNEDEKYLNKWLKNKFHGSMNYMEKHGLKRSRPDVLLPGTVRVISLKMHYFSRGKGISVNTSARKNQDPLDLSIRFVFFPIQPKPAFLANALSKTGAVSTK